MTIVQAGVDTQQQKAKTIAGSPPTEKSREDSY